MLELVLRRVRAEEAQALVEYALLIGLITIVVVAALRVMGEEVDRLISLVPGVGV